MAAPVDATAVLIAPRGSLSLRLFSLCVVLFSGAAALLFETLFFRVASLALGVTQWASAAVLAGFMLGLGGGALWVLRRDRLILHPARTFMRVEAAAAVSAFLLVLLLPYLAGVIATGLGAFREVPTLLHGLRVVLAIALFALPAGAMGATLPLWLRAAAQFSGQHYGVRLGLLYGGNVLGAVGGALVCEFLLIPRFGIPGAAAAGLLFSGVAILCAWRCATVAQPGSGQADADSAPAILSDTTPPRAGSALLPVHLLLASLLCGLALLGLEVTWFRFLHLYVINSALTFAVMLALLLAAGGLGSLLVAAVLFVWRDAGARIAWLLAALSAGAVVLSYWFFAPVSAGADRYWFVTSGDTLVLTARLVCLPAFLSGALFTAIGGLIRHDLRSDAGAGAVWLASNTLGAVAGSVLAAFLFLPLLGMQWTLQVFAAVYLLIGILLLPALGGWRSRGVAIAVMIALAVPMMQLPSQLEEEHLARATEKFRHRDGSHTVLVRHGRGETLQYLRRDFLGKPWFYRQVTDGFSMSANTADSRRYMELFAWWPAAVHPELRSALLVSYGLGTTASALLAIPGLQQLDVVDVSADILATSEIAHGDDASPLHDARTRVFVEDGRFFLHAPPQRYDLVTSEPPPPRARGVVNLYTREYFALVKSALNPGGLFTYWLPVDQMNVASMLAIVRGFCDVYADCALWAGANYNWMLTGSNERNGETPAATALWNLPASRARLARIGLEAPAALSATFIADAADLQRWSAGIPPLLDAQPQRLQPDFAGPSDLELYFAWMDDLQTEKRFARSAYIRQHWPAGMQKDATLFFPFQAILNHQVRPGSAGALSSLDALLRHSRLQTPVWWVLDSDGRRQDIARDAEEVSPAANWHRAVGAIAQREFHLALDWLRTAEVSESELHAQVRLYLHCLTGQFEAARQWAEQLRSVRGWTPAYSCPG